MTKETLCATVQHCKKGQQAPWVGERVAGAGVEILVELPLIWCKRGMYVGIRVYEPEGFFITLELYFLPE